MTATKVHPNLPRILLHRFAAVGTVLMAIVVMHASADVTASLLGVVPRI